VQEAYKLFGEAVPVPLAYSIAVHIGAGRRSDGRCSSLPEGSCKKNFL